ncbi:hypothetical protein LCGC14_2319090, partial [marine sediment metagenome]
RQIDSQITTKTRTTDTTKKILNLDKQYNFNGIGIDDSGVGGGVFDQLYDNDQTKRKVKGLNNASKPIDWKTKKEKIINYS